MLTLFRIISDGLDWDTVFNPLQQARGGDNESMELKVYSCYKKGSPNNLSSIWQYETWTFFRHCYQLLHWIGGRGFYLTLELSSLGE